MSLKACKSAVIVAQIVTLLTCPTRDNMTRFQRAFLEEFTDEYCKRVGLIPPPREHLDRYATLDQWRALRHYPPCRAWFESCDDYRRTRMDELQPAIHDYLLRDMRVAPVNSPEVLLVFEARPADHTNNPKNTAALPYFAELARIREGFAVVGS